MAGSRKASGTGRPQLQGTLQTRTGKGQLIPSTVPSFVRGSLSTFTGTMRTRGFHRAILQTFDFLTLPAEIRVLVYLAAINFDGVTRYLRELAIWEYTGIRRQPVLSRTTPSLFLVCKQITNEILVELAKIPLMLPNFFGVNDLTKLMTPKVLRTLHFVEIDIKPFDEEACMVINLRALQYIAKELSRIWAFGGHNLKRLTINLEDSRIMDHFQLCPPDQCYLREEVESALDVFSHLRNVTDVSFGGILTSFDHSAHVASMMQIPVNYMFMDLPENIRNKIYHYTLDWNESMGVMDKVLMEKAVLSSRVRKSKAAAKIPSNKIYHKYSPAILRINKEISTEALKVLHDRCLTVSTPPRKKYHITDFISRDTLQGVRKVTLEIHEETWGHWADWERLRAELGKIFQKRNRLQVVEINGTYKESSIRAAKAFLKDLKEEFGCKDEVIIKDSLFLSFKSPNTRSQLLKRSREPSVEVERGY